MTDLLAPRPGNGHLNEDQRDRALLVLAMNGSHSEQAHEQLKAEGLNVSARYLRQLRDTDRYKHIRETQAHQIERGLVTYYQDVARVNAELALESAGHTLQALRAGEIKPVDAAKVGQQAMVASGIAFDKALVADGRPNVITGTEDLDHAVARMQRRLGIPSTAEDITEATLTPESAVLNAGQ